MKPSNTFQILIIGVAVFLLIIGIVVFALFGGKFGGGSQGPVVIWGTSDSQTMNNVINTLRITDKSFDSVTYVQKDVALYENGIVNAIAAGSPPDLLLLPQADIAQFSDKLQIIPYSSVSQSAYTNAFVDEAQLFLTPVGEYALPLMIDPLVMYWNRDLFATAGIASPPALWSDLINNAPKLTTSDAAGNIKRSAAALGLWNNVTNAKAIFSTLVMQAGDRIVAQNEATGKEISVFGSRPQGAVETPAESALRFYTDFANPSKSVYSWNRAQPDAQDAFAAGNSALYFGYASEAGELQARNPNLHFGVALMPQAQGGSTNITYGNMTGLAIPRGAKNATGALAIAQKFTASAGADLIAQNFHLPPVARALIQNVPDDATQQIFMKSALIARAWYDPNPPATNSIFQAMVESVVSGAVAPADAVMTGTQAFTRLLPQTQ